MSYAVQSNGLGHAIRKTIWISGRTLLWCGKAVDLDPDRVVDERPEQMCPSCLAELRNQETKNVELAKANALLHREPRNGNNYAPDPLAKNDDKKRGTA